MSLRLSLAGGLALAIALASVAPVAARTPPTTMNPRGGAVSDERTGFDVHDKAHIKNELKLLHDDAVALQKADGGKLSDTHRAELTQRMEVLRKEACSAGLAGC